MSDVIIPPWIVPEEESQEPLDEGSSVFRAAFAPGLAQRQSYGGLRLKLSRRHTVRTEEKAQLLAALKATRGSYNALRSKVHFARRGSFDASELLTNSTFSNGTTGFTGATAYAIAVADRVVRSTRTAAPAAAGSNLILSDGAATTQYAPYIARVFLSNTNISGSTFHVAIRSAGTTLLTSGTATSSPGLHYTTYAGSETTLRVALRESAVGADIAGRFADIPYISLSRCALVDNGPNAISYSDELDNAAWTKSDSTVSANATTAPDGASTADAVVENSATAAHYVVQSGIIIGSSAADLCLAVALKANSRTWAQLQIFEQTGSTTAAVFVNLSTGALGSVSTGANWSNVRAVTQSLGNGWYYVALIARKTNAATLVNPAVVLATGDGVTSYLGDGSSNIYAWRATFKESSVPIRLSLRTTGSVVGTSQTGAGMHIKGLPASTSGLLLPEDIFEINGELKTCTSSLDTDAAGLGYLQFEPALVRSPSDNDPVIIHDPMGKFLTSNIKIDNEFGTQARVSYDLEHIYE